LALLLETIRCEDGYIHHLPYHQSRCTYSRQQCFATKDSLDLASILEPPKQGVYRCRILYNKSIQKIEYIPYETKEIQSLNIITSSIEYPLKYANREALNTLKALSPQSDDILIEKDGYLRDTSIANIAFYNGKTWHTPKYPLLHGTMRQNMIDKGRIEVKEIHINHLSSYSKVALMNAMIGFKILNTISITYTKDSHDTYNFSKPSLYKDYGEAHQRSTLLSY
jgi:4-amino-4-deoxychorismate lyase